jgi:hypothetical protein
MPVCGVDAGMMSSSQDILALLKARGLIDSNRGRVVWTRRARHETVLVRGGDGQSFLVKRFTSPLSGETIKPGYEGIFFRLIQGDQFADLRPLMPKLLLIDDDGKTVVFEGFPEHIDLMGVAIQGPISADTLCAAELLGRGLAVLHAADYSALASVLPRIEQPVVTFGNCTPEGLAHGARAFVELLRLVQRDGTLNGRLRDLRSAWRCDALIHGDAKLDNMLVPAAPGGQPPLIIIDWELAGLGDSRWDCASVIGSALYSVFQRQAVRKGVASLAEDYREASRLIRAFWNAYLGHRLALGGCTFDMKREEDAVFCWVGFWLLKRVLVLLPIYPVLTTSSLACLHLASELIKAPCRWP